jgi:biopolymer transport protein ExbD
MFGFRRRRRRKGNEELDVQLPITPMLDMAFQIFAFFAATYQPSAFEGQMQLNLPAIGETKAAEQSQATSNDSDKELKLPSEVTITINTKQDGINDSMPRQYVVSTPQDPEHKVTTLDELATYLAKARTGLTNQEEVTIKADSRLRYTFVVQVMDLCVNPKKAGFKHVGFGPPPDMEAPKGK